MTFVWLIDHFEQHTSTRDVLDIEKHLDKFLTDFLNGGRDYKTTIGTVFITLNATCAALIYINTNMLYMLFYSSQGRAGQRRTATRPKEEKTEYADHW